MRIDDGVREGDPISPFYDSMIAKLIVHGDTREQALARLDEALAQTHIVGLATNVQFLRYVVRSPSFAQANLDTALIPREQAVLFNQEPVGLAAGRRRGRGRRPCSRSGASRGQRPVQPARRLALAWRDGAPLRVRVPRRAGRGRAGATCTTARSTSRSAT